MSQHDYNSFEFQPFAFLAFHSMREASVLIAREENEEKVKCGKSAVAWIFV